MNILEQLDQSAVPESIQHSAFSSLMLAQNSADGLNWDKWKVRLFKADKISKLLTWEDERLCLKYPEFAYMDVAPMENIRSYGDTLPWVETPIGGRPPPPIWLDKDPASADYQQAITYQKRYFKGVHPRSREGHKIWYRRNGGEYMAWDRGQEVFPDRGEIDVWTSKHNVVMHHSGAWFLEAYDEVAFKVFKVQRLGFEVGNVFDPKTKLQGWFPIDGFKLKAPVTMSTTFKRIK